MNTTFYNNSITRKNIFDFSPSPFGVPVGNIFLSFESVFDTISFFRIKNTIFITKNYLEQ